MASIEPFRWSDSDYASAVRDVKEAIIRGLAIPGRLLGHPSMRDAFLADILAAPHDDTPRLVYADWLDDNATSEAERARAEFIRLQCTGTAVRRWSELPLGKQEQAELGPWMPFYEQVRKAEWLLYKHGGQWVPTSLGGGFRLLPDVQSAVTTTGEPWHVELRTGQANPDRYDVSWRWSRGWPNHLHLSPSAWLALGDHFLKVWPVTEVELTEPFTTRLLDIEPDEAPFSRRLDRVRFRGHSWNRNVAFNREEMAHFQGDAVRYVVDMLCHRCWPTVRFTVAQQPATVEG